MTALQRWQHRLKSLGRFPARPVTWLGAALFCIWALIDVMVLHLSHGLAQPTYDGMVRMRLHARPPDPRIVIVDIDEASLARMGREFGQWPWPRDTLATVLDFIERQQPAAIAWDVIFSDADRASPGGDAAFDAAARRSAHSHFSVVRLPSAGDEASEVRRELLPRLWVPPSVVGTPSVSTSPVALIPPRLPGVAAARLGFNNGYADGDGVLRRYRYAERLPDGSVIQSLPLSVVSALNPAAYAALVGDVLHADASDPDGPQGELIDWRAAADVYPRVPFADVFGAAEQSGTLGPVPSFAGKIVVVGATAPALHDIHPTPLSPNQQGVESLATVLDDALNGHHLLELPRWSEAALACVFFIGIALWVDARGVTSLSHVTLVLPALLLGLSYASLNIGRMYLDLHLAAGLGLLFLAALRVWNALRRDYWYSMPDTMPSGGLAAWAILGRDVWNNLQLDSLLNALEQHAPDCRVVANDPSASWPTGVRWPDLARAATVVGPAASLEAALPRLRKALGSRLVLEQSLLHMGGAAPGELFATVFQGWSDLFRRLGPPPERLVGAMP